MHEHLSKRQSFTLGERPRLHLFLQSQSPDLGSPMGFTPLFFDKLLADSITHLHFQNCADMPRGGVDGLTVEALLDLLEKKWSISLTSLVLSRMVEQNLHSQEPLWDWAAMEKIEEKLADVATSRSQKLILKHDVREAVSSLLHVSKDKRKGSKKRGI